MILCKKWIKISCFCFQLTCIKMRSDSLQNIFWHRSQSFCFYTRVGGDHPWGYLSGQCHSYLGLMPLIALIGRPSESFPDPFIGIFTPANHWLAFLEVFLIQDWFVSLAVIVFVRLYYDISLDYSSLSVRYGMACNVPRDVCICRLYASSSTHRQPPAPHGLQW